jgi:2-succinyl-5-enolpyruvyl-6-hydroxy-3-cyclohexene-1-carboxylate synthase
MIPINRTYAPIQALVDELARCGMRHAITSPGSRNAPLALTLAAEPRIAAHSVIDERSAGFVALGIAKATGTPVAVTCTSGTAAANLMPAMVEAYESRVPLIVLSADRPPELRDVGAGQAIDQIKLYGSFAKWFVEVGNFEPSRDTAVHHRALACRAYATARGGRPGPVHLNFPLREPLAPVAEELDATDWEGRDGGAPWVVVDDPLPRLPEDVAGEMRERIAAAPRGVLVAGGGTGAPDEVAELATALGWPVLADATSGLRCGPEAERAGSIAHYDVVLRSERFADAHVPDLVVRVGDTPTSKPLRAFLTRAPQIVVDPAGSWNEPTRLAERVLRCSAAELRRALPARTGGDPAWLDSWREADALIPAALAEVEGPFEPHVWNAVAHAAPAGSTLWVASSMPIRDVEAFLPRDGKPLTILSNRGANGIDGTASSAAGAALGLGARTFLLTGELALLHDVGGLLAARRLGADLTVVCANNGGGGIFDFLPVAGAAESAAYEEHIATPSGIDLKQAAKLAGLPYVLASSQDELRAAVEQPALVEVRTDRRRGVEQRRAVHQAVAGGLA